MGRKGNQTTNPQFKKITFGKSTGRDYRNDNYRGSKVRGGGGSDGGRGDGGEGGGGGRGGGRGGNRGRGGDGGGGGGGGRGRGRGGDRGRGGGDQRTNGFRGDSRQRFDQDSHFQDYSNTRVNNNNNGYGSRNNSANTGYNDYAYVYGDQTEEQPKEPPPLMSVAVPSRARPKEPVTKVTQPNVKAETAPVQKPSTSLKSAQPTTPVTPKKAAKSEPIIDIKSIKKEKSDTVPTPDPKKVVVQKKEVSSSESSSSSSSSSSSEDSSSSDEEVPSMPKPITKIEYKEKPAEDDVVCLGKQSNVESLLDDDDDDDANVNVKKECLVCKSQEHSAEKCIVKCTKCSNCSYSTQIVCNTCGETYPPKVSASQQQNPFFMFMQFMQFFMSQYTGIKTEMNQPIPGPNPVRGCTKDVEITRQDIVNNSKSHHKKSKSETKRRKKRKSQKSSDSDSDSDSSSKATTSTKKRRKTDAGKPTMQSMPHFSGIFPNTASFSSPAYNPMLAFSQMMGLNPAAMNFQR